MSATDTTAPAAEGATGELVERLFGAALGVLDVHTIYIGDRLGLYAPLAAAELTSSELATATGLEERYVREWLEQQAVSDILAVDDAGKEALARRYSLPPGHAEVLLDRDHPDHFSSFIRMLVGIVRQAPAVIDAFRSGRGVEYADYDADFCEGQGDMNRIAFVNELASKWLPAVPDIHQRLGADPPARVADVACGTGHSTVAIAEAYPVAEVVGIDVDEHSIEIAKRNGEASAASGRVRFERRDAASGLGGPYELVTIFEAVHDMSRPVEVLEAVRASLSDDGTVIVADERVAEAFTAPGDEVERLMYGYSVLHCLPVGMAEQPSAATGTVMRTDMLREYATAAGFGEIEVLPIENDFWRFYRLSP